MYSDKTTLNEEVLEMDGSVSLFTIKDIGSFNPLMPGGSSKVTHT